MAISNVRFMFGTKAKYDALETKDPLALYFITDEATGESFLYKGAVLHAKGNEATTTVSGLMSAADKAKLDALVDSGMSGYVAADGSIVIEDGSIKVAISSEAGNALSLRADGLFVDASTAVEIPEYSIEKQATADEGDAVTYKLKMTVGTESNYVGDAINIPKDLVISSGVLDVVAETDVPYSGAVIGDPFLDLTLSNASADHIYIPVKGLVDVYRAGEGLQEVDGTFSIKLGSEANGLHFVDGSLSLALATKDVAGALSAVDKAFIDSIPDTYATKAELEAAVSWTEM
jgi:hypothetical protein